MSFYALDPKSESLHPELSRADGKVCKDGLGCLRRVRIRTSYLYVEVYGRGVCVCTYVRM